MSYIRKYAPEILLCAALAVLWVWMLFVASAPPAAAQQSCTVQSFDPPLESGWAMPGDADTVSIFFTDGTGVTLTGPFVLGDVITHPGQVAASIEKCTGSIPAPDPTPDPQPTPTVAPEPTPEPQPTPTPIESCCTTIVTPGPEPTPTPIIPAPPATPERPDATPTGQLITHTPTPAVPMLPNTGRDTGPLVVAGLALIGGGMLVAAARRT